MKEIQVKSKIYIQKKTNKALIIIVGICVIITAILGMISVINNGVKIGNISPIMMALVVGICVFEESKAKAYYHFDIASVYIGNQLKICYKDSQLQIIFEIREISLLQYSDQLKCLRIVGNYKKKQKNTEEIIYNQEHLLYVGDGEEISIIDELERISKLKVQYMDR